MEQVFDALVRADHQIYEWVLNIVGRSALLDGLMGVFTSNALVKGVIPALVFWHLWFLPQKPTGRRQTKTRSLLLAVLFTTVIAIAIGRALANFMPFRPRPNASPAFLDEAAVTLSPQFYEEWSSLPSDHAVMFCCIAVGIMLANRLLGALLLIHALPLVGYSRVHLGLHFPLDILSGAVVGAIVALVLVRPLARLIDRLPARFSPTYIMSERPYLFYPVMFFLTFQFATMFDSVRQLTRSAASAILRIAGS